MKLDITTYHELISDKVKVSLEYIGEGWKGDFDLNDPEDTRLLHFDVQIHRSLDGTYEHAEFCGGRWNQVHDASYCTALPIDSSKQIIKTTLRHIMEEVKPVIKSNDSIKRICERLSMISPQSKFLTR